MSEIESAREVLKAMRDTILRQTDPHALWALEDVIDALNRHDRKYPPMLDACPLWRAPEPR